MHSFLVLINTISFLFSFQVYLFTQLFYTVIPDLNVYQKYKALLLKF